MVLVFAGQGAQWVGMGRRLLEESSVFAGRLAECDEVIGGLTGWSVVEVLRGVGGPGLDRVDVVQPVLFAVMVSVAAVWESLGVSVGAVVGHSQGEVAAACVAGVLSLEDAVRVVVARSGLLVELVGRGGMVSVGLPVGEVEGFLVGSGVSVAVVNGPSSTVVAGPVGELERLVGVWTAGGVRARRLEVSYASHHVGVEVLEERLLEVMAGVCPGAGRVPVYSSLRGGRVEGAEMDGGYWFENVRGAVRFDRVVGALLGDGFRGFVEVGPHPVLRQGLEECFEVGGVAGEGWVVGSMVRGDGSWAGLLAGVAGAFVRGVDVDWARVVGGGRGVELPTYAFQRQRYWL
ncbi:MULTISPECIES: acyltransferase domain-containing protein, partial [unclassified Streptomyces]|uniref:acyltransferase domain-containing protein n=1 Tax=unclassified Streptomyces TaxID=2593676 RepID=UPI0036E00A48